MAGFKFVDDKINARFLLDLERDGISFTAVEDGVICDEDVICAARDRLFPQGWQVVSFPRDCLEAYRNYVTLHGIECVEEVEGSEVNFLVAESHDPHDWNIL